MQIIAWRPPGDKPLSEPMMVSLLMHICVTRPQWVKPPVYSFASMLPIQLLPGSNYTSVYKRDAFREYLTIANNAIIRQVWRKALAIWKVLLSSRIVILNIIMATQLYVQGLTICGRMEHRCIYYSRPGVCFIRDTRRLLLTRNNFNLSMGK